MFQAQEELPNEKFTEEQLDKDLAAFILMDRSSPSDVKGDDPVPKTPSKDIDKELDDLLFGIEKGQLEIENSKEEGEANDDQPKDGSPKLSEPYETDDMDVLILQEQKKLADSVDRSEGDSGWRSSEWTQSDASSDNEDDADYVFTDDQKRASLELEQLRAENDYFPAEDPPEYDVKDRIKQLNEELAKEPLPDEREHKVMFKENPVSLVVPPAEDWGDKGTTNTGPTVSEDSNVTINSVSDANNDTRSYTGTSQVRDKDFSYHKDVETAKSTTREDKDNSVEHKQTTESSSQVVKSSKHDKVLIERDGKFELVAADDVNARGLGLGLSLPADVSASVSVNSKPRPPSEPRPVSSSGYGQRSPPRPTRTRPHSAVVNHSPALQSFSYMSPYGLSNEEKQKLEGDSTISEPQIDSQRLREERQKKALEKKRDEERKKRKENEDAFRSWLQQKRNSAKWTSDDEKKPQTQNLDQDKIVKDWLQQKKEQNRREKLLKRRQEEERRCNQSVRTQQDCEQAFKQWLRKKSQEAIIRQRLEREKYGIFMRRRRHKKTIGAFELADWSYRTGYHGF